MSVAIEELLKPISEEAPSGEDAEYDDLYMQLEELAQGVPSRQMGESIVEGQDPDWSELKKSCETLFEKTHDLRVATYLSLAELCLQGLRGFQGGLQLIYQLLNNEWETLWPQLDPDDDYDPLERINILSSLTPVPGAYQDPMMFVQHLRNVPLTDSRQMGKFSLRDIMLANGELESTDNQSLDMSVINAAFADTPSDVRNSNYQAVCGILDTVGDISQLLTDKVGVDRSISFATLTSEIERMKRYYEQFGSSLDSEAAVEENDEPDTEDGDEADGASQSKSTPPVTKELFSINNLEISNRSDAITVLDKVCIYFEQTEPNSPIPYLLKRAARIAHMNFIDLIQELSPNALEQAQDILGIHNVPDDESE